MEDDPPASQEFASQEFASALKSSFIVNAEGERHGGEYLLKYTEKQEAFVEERLMRQEPTPLVKVLNSIVELLPEIGHNTRQTHNNGKKIDKLLASHKKDKRDLKSENRQLRDTIEKLKMQPCTCKEAAAAPASKAAPAKPKRRQTRPLPPEQHCCYLGMRREELEAVYDR